MSTTIPVLSPEMAKEASRMLRVQQTTIDALEKKAASLQEENDGYKRREECLKIAHQLSEIRRIPKDFGSILERAEAGRLGQGPLGHQGSHRDGSGRLRPGHRGELETWVGAGH